MTEIEKFKEEWGVSGMPLEKIRLVDAAIKAGMLAAADIAAKEFINCVSEELTYNEGVADCVSSIKDEAGY